MSATNYTLTFVNGVAAAKSLPVGTYSYVSNTLPGYTDGSVAQFEVTPTTTEVTLQLSAAGTLSISVKDDLDAPVTDGALQLSSADGETRYGSEVDIVSGAASFAHVPHTEEGVALHVAQNGSDASHDPLAAPQLVTMKAAAQSETVLNDRKTLEVTPRVVDANYPDILALNGDVVING